MIRRARRGSHPPTSTDPNPPDPPDAPDARDGAGPGKVRLQRVLAAAGVAARRACEALIEAGRVEVNGTVVRTLPVFVDPARDTITVDGRAIPRAKTSEQGRQRPGTSLAGQRFIYLMVYKPERVLSTTRDEAGRTTVMDLVDHPALARQDQGGLGARVYPVGRLDFHTSGLVLLTNDGDLANRLTHPRFGVPKTYAVWAKGDMPQDFARDLERGLNLKHRRAAAQARGTRAPSAAAAPAAADPNAAIVIGPPRADNGKTMVEITLHERGPRSLADMLGEAGVTVSKMVRTAIGPLHLRGVALGQWRELDRQELQALRRAARGIAAPRDRAHPPSSAPPRPPRRPRPSRAARPSRPERSGRPERPGRPERSDRRPGSPATAGSRPRRPGRRDRA